MTLDLWNLTFHISVERWGEGGNIDASQLNKEVLFYDFENQIFVNLRRRGRRSRSHTHQSLFGFALSLSLSRFFHSVGGRDGKVEMRESYRLVKVIRFKVE